MDRPPVRVGVVDIGTNSMRLLVTDGSVDIDRRVEVDRAWTASIEPAFSLPAIEEYAGRSGPFPGGDGSGGSGEAGGDRHIGLPGHGEPRGVLRPRRVCPRSAAEPDHRGGGSPSCLRRRHPFRSTPPNRSWSRTSVGGSTEFVTAGGEVSFDIGSVRLTERVINSRPASPNEMRRPVSWLPSYSPSRPGGRHLDRGCRDLDQSGGNCPGASRELAGPRCTVTDERWLPGGRGRLPGHDDPGGDGRHPCPRSRAGSVILGGGAGRRGGDGHSGHRRGHGLGA